MFVCIPCQAQTSLSDSEKQYAAVYFGFYGGKFEGVEPNTTQLDSYIYATEEEKRQMLKDFVVGEWLPRRQNALTRARDTVQKLEAEIQELQNYID